MMNIGIVGSEAAKFTPETEEQAKLQISHILQTALENDAADYLGIPKSIFPPKVYSWEAGYKPRNILIAQNSDILYVIALKKLPYSFKRMLDRLACG